jgi:hypothetical protein
MDNNKEKLSIDGNELPDLPTLQKTVLDEAIE